MGQPKEKNKKQIDIPKMLDAWELGIRRKMAAVFGEEFTSEIFANKYLRGKKHLIVDTMVAIRMGKLEPEVAGLLQRVKRLEISLEDAVARNAILTRLVADKQGEEALEDMTLRYNFSMHIYNFLRETYASIMRDKAKAEEDKVEKEKALEAEASLKELMSKDVGVIIDTSVHNPGDKKHPPRAKIFNG